MAKETTSFRHVSQIIWTELSNKKTLVTVSEDGNRIDYIAEPGCCYIFTELENEVALLRQANARYINYNNRLNKEIWRLRQILSEEGVFAGDVPAAIGESDGSEDNPGTET